MVVHACGYLGLRLDYFYSLTVGEYSLIAKGITKRMEDSQMMDLYNTRTVAYFSMLPHVKNPPSIQKFMPLPIDEQGGGDKQSHKWAELSEIELSKKFGD